jgi:hypothetical protein
LIVLIIVEWAIVHDRGSDEVRFDEI